MPQSSTTNLNLYMKYNPSLDTLRCFCIILVIISHWGPQATTLPNHIIIAKVLSVFNDGNLAVDIFFVLSGYLIIYGLIELRENENRILPFRYKVYIFYVKRFFRIFPIYYTLLLVLYIFNYPQIREYFLYFVTYNSNNLSFIKSSWNSLSHTWTLSTEEQFYLIWPFIIFLIPAKKLVKAIFIIAFCSSVIYVIELSYLNP